MIRRLVFIWSNIRSGGTGRGLLTLLHSTGFQISGRLYWISFKKCLNSFISFIFNSWREDDKNDAALHSCILCALFMHSIFIYSELIAYRQRAFIAQVYITVQRGYPILCFIPQAYSQYGSLPRPVEQYCEYWVH